MARDLKYRNRHVALVSFFAAAGMVGASFAAVPLYEVFCQVTGYGGTTQTAEAAPGTVLKRKMAIRFNADVDKALPWKFAAAQDKVDNLVSSLRQQILLDAIDAEKFPAILALCGLEAAPPTRTSPRRPSAASGHAT